MRTSPQTSVILAAAPIGVAAALSTQLAKQVLALGNRAIFGSSADIVIAMASLGPLSRVLTPCVGGIVAGLLALAAKRAEGDTDSDYMDAIARGEGQIRIAPTLLRTLSSFSSIVTGGSVGREGAMVQIAAMIASLGSRLQGVLSGGHQAVRTLTACGAAAGLASVYHTPLAGAVFVAEIILGTLTADSLIPLFVATSFALLTVRQFDGTGPLYVVVHPDFHGDAGELFATLIIAVVAGLIAPAFLWALDHTHKAFDRLPLPMPLRLALGGLLVGLIALRLPEVCGNGFPVVQQILRAETLAPALWLLFLAKALATLATVGSGGIGGLFTPSLLLGALLGGCAVGAAEALGLHLADESSFFALVGMGAFLSATSHAPLMSLLMVFEMSLDSAVLFPLILATVVSYLLSRSLRGKSLYSVMNWRRGKPLAARRFEAQSLTELLEPVTVTLPASATFGDARALFDRARTRYQYVVDEEGRFLGAVSIHAVLAHTAGGLDPTLPLENAIEDDFIVLPLDASPADAWDAFEKHALERIPLVLSHDDRRLAGVISKAKLLRTAHALRN